MPIPTHVLLTAVDFNAALPAQAVATAVARGLEAGGLPESDLIALPRPQESGAADIRELLDSLDFDRRMRTARAVVIADGHLSEDTLAGSATFEIATRARQAGVPAYAITAENKLDAFDARILDLQMILEAGTTRALAAAGRKLTAAVTEAIERIAGDGGVLPSTNTLLTSAARLAEEHGISVYDAAYVAARPPERGHAGQL